jgi:hypothetical protein
VSPQRSTSNMNVRRNISNYFLPQAQKLLHFFNEKSIFFLDLEQLSKINKFTQTELNIASPVPSFHKSIIIPNGDIYLIGGNVNSSKSDLIFIFNKRRLTLDPVGKLNDARSSHSICYLGIF